MGFLLCINHYVIFNLLVAVVGSWQLVVFFLTNYQLLLPTYFFVALSF